MNEFLQTLKTQRWDDHRYYHQSRINQSLHFISAISFLVAYVYLFIDPVMSGLIAWIVSMGTRQAGHFFFEPDGFDEVNNVTNQYKEDVKVGYNLNRKKILIAICVAVPLLSVWMPSSITWMVPQEYEDSALRMTGIIWLYLGISGVVFRMIQLVWLDGWLASVSWGIKIITDPFHDIKLYYKSPIYLLKGELLDPMTHVHGG
jgi:hypothetical protein